MSFMLRLYPRAWRRRYGDEVARLLASEPRSFRLFLDLIAGAIDARINPQWTPVTAPSGEPPSMKPLLRCVRSKFSAADMRHSAAWMIGGSLGLVLISLVLELVFDLTLLSQTLLFSAYPMALILSSRTTYLRPYPRPVRVILLVLASAAMFGFFLFVTVLADRI